MRGVEFCETLILIKWRKPHAMMTPSQHQLRSERSAVLVVADNKILLLSSKAMARCAQTFKIRYPMSSQIYITIGIYYQFLNMKLRSVNRSFGRALLGFDLRYPLIPKFRHQSDDA